MVMMMRMSVCIILENMQNTLLCHSTFLFFFFFFINEYIKWKGNFFWSSIMSMCVNTFLPYFCSRQIHFDDVLLTSIDWFAILYWILSLSFLFSRFPPGPLWLRFMFKWIFSQTKSLTCTSHQNEEEEKRRKKINQFTNHRSH